MSRRIATSTIFRLLSILVISSGLMLWLIEPGRSQDVDDGLVKLAVNQAVENIWESTDGPVARNEVDRAWLWGPKPIGIATEYFTGSPTGQRQLIYYDKGRLDILDPDRDLNDPWFAAGGLLVSEMLSGRVQLGVEQFVNRPQPELSLVGDIVPENNVTYKTLAPFATVSGADAAPERTGQALTALLKADGQVQADAIADSTTLVAHYDALTGRNIAAPFEEWGQAQPYTTLYLLGHPLTEPYWIDTLVAGRLQTVLIQAFERRVMVYTPNNPIGFRVESTNVGRHYRLWRQLLDINDPKLIPLASGEPFGDSLVSAALSQNIDPFMLAAISSVTLAKNQFTSLVNLQQAVSDDATSESSQLVDPTENAASAAELLKQWIPVDGGDFDWRAVLANYYTQGNPDWNDPNLGSFVQDVLHAYGRLQESYPPLEVEEPRKLEQADASAEVDQTYWGGRLDAGRAAYYDPSYGTAWWERTLRLYARQGLIAADWEDDPNGYYCVRPGYIPGERLRVRANGATITCTIGDMVADRDLENWLLVSNWGVELNWPAFSALGLPYSNWVDVDFPGTWAKSPPPIPPRPAPTPEPSPTPMPTDQATETPAVAPSTPMPTPSPTPSAAPQPEPPTATPQLEPTSQPTLEPVPGSTEGAGQPGPSPTT